MWRCDCARAYRRETWREKAGGGGNGYPRDPESLFSLFEGGESTWQKGPGLTVSMNVNESVIGEKGAQERGGGGGGKAEEAGTAVEKGLVASVWGGADRRWRRLWPRERNGISSVSTLFSIGERRVGNGSSAGANGGIGRDEKSMKRREGEDKGRRTRTRRCALARNNGAIARIPHERSFYYREQPRISYVLIKLRFFHPPCSHLSFVLLTAASR